MHLFNLLPILALTATTSAGSLTLKNKSHWWGTGCDLRFDNVCGCTKTVAVNKIHTCEALPDVYTYGKVCGGHWSLDVHHSKHAVRFYGKNGCKSGCFLNSRHSGAHCEGKRMRG